MILNIPKIRFYPSQLAIIEDPLHTEAEILFFSQNHIFGDYAIRESKSHKKISVKEYIYKYAFYDFLDFLEKKYNVICRVDNSLLECLHYDKK